MKIIDLWKSDVNCKKLQIAEIKPTERQIRQQIFLQFARPNRIATEKTKEPNKKTHVRI